MLKKTAHFLMLFIIYCTGNQPIHSMSALEQLSSEILQEEIINRLSKDSIRNLRLASKTCNAQSKARWNAIRLCVNFPEAYGIELIEPQSWRITSPDGKNFIVHNTYVNFPEEYGEEYHIELIRPQSWCVTSYDRRRFIVNDLRNLGICPIPDCTSKYKIRPLPKHLLSINGNLDTCEQHDILKQLIHFLYVPLKTLELESQKIKTKRYADILNSDINSPDDIANNEKRNSKLADKIMKKQKLTDTQISHMVRWFENKLTSLHKSEKKERQLNRKMIANIKIENGLKARQNELAEKKELKHQNTNAAKDTQTIQPKKTRPLSPSEKMMLETRRRQIIQKKKSAGPFAKIAIYIEIPPIDFTGYCRTNQSDGVESEIENMGKSVMSAFSMYAAQNIDLLPESDEFLPQQNKKRGADFPEDEPSFKRARVFSATNR